MKKIAIIGGASGIGEALAKSLKNSGHEVYTTYNKNKPVDTTIPSDRLNVLEENPDMGFLPAELDGLAYCPGSINLKPFKRFSAQDFMQDYELQLVGFVRVLQKALPLLKQSNEASVVAFSTVAVQKGFNFHSLVSASKGAMEGLIRSLAAEYAPKIRFNCVAPSLTDTPMAGNLINTEAKMEANANRHPMKRVGQPEDIAALAEFLLSEKSSWITGQVLHVDGGMSSINQ